MINKDLTDRPLTQAIMRLGGFNEHFVDGIGVYNQQGKAVPSYDCWAEVDHRILVEPAAAGHMNAIHSQLYAIVAEMDLPCAPKK